MGKNQAGISPEDIPPTAESERQFRLLADNAPVLIWRSGTDKQCDYFNKPWLDFTGRPVEQELGFGWADGVHPDDLDRCVAIYNGAFDAREDLAAELPAVDVGAGRGHLHHREGLDQVGIEAQLHAGNVKVLEGAGGLDAVVGVGRDRLVAQEVVFNAGRVG